MHVHRAARPCYGDLGRIRTRIRFPLRRRAPIHSSHEAVMIEILAAIDAPHFYAGVVLWDDRVVEAADIIKYMRI